MTEPYRLPTATVLSAVQSGEVSTTTLVISREDYLSYPVAPPAFGVLALTRQSFIFVS